MSLQFTSIDDAFSPLSQRKRRHKTEDQTPPPAHAQQEPAPPPPIVHPPQLHQQQEPARSSALASLTEEVFVIQPYINNLFMLFVLGMLYDIRQVALDLRTNLLLKASL